MIKKGLSVTQSLNLHSHQISQGLETMLYGGQMKEMGLFYPERRRADPECLHTIEELHFDN